MHPFIRTSDVGQIRFGQIATASDLLNDAGVEKLRLVPKGSILMPKSGASTFLNHRVEMAVDAYVSSHLATIFPRPDRALSRYLLYYLWTVRAQDMIQDHKYPSLTLGLIKSIEIPLPPLEEQKRIVAVLDQAFAALDRARANAEANLADAEELFEAELRAIFIRDAQNWERCLLPELCTHFGRGKSKHRPRNDPALYGGDIPFIQTGDISEADHFLTEFRQTYSKEGLEQSKLWPKGTICIAIVGATIGETAILDFDACFPDSVIGLRPDPTKLHPEFVEFMLQAFKDDLKQAGKGSARDNINLGTFERQKFPVPALEVQTEVVEKMEGTRRAADSLRAAYAKKLVDLDDLRQSILQKAFAGELTELNLEALPS